MMYDRRDCTDAGDDPDVTTKWSREYAKELERRKSVVYEKRIDPKHPYCTNWPTKWSLEYAKELERRKVVYEKRIDPKHPYCTNWPIPKNLTNEEE